MERGDAARAKHEDLDGRVGNKLGFFDAITHSLRPEGHIERQARALWILRWTPMILFGAAALFAIALGWKWQSWSRRGLRASVGLLLGAALAIPPLSTLIALYPLFFSIARPDSSEIVAATSEAMNELAFGVLLDCAALALFLVSRAVRRSTNRAG